MVMHFNIYNQAYSDCIHTVSLRTLALTLSKLVLHRTSFISRFQTKECYPYRNLEQQGHLHAGVPSLGHTPHPLHSLLRLTVWGGGFWNVTFKLI